MTSRNRPPWFPPYRADRHPASSPLLGEPAPRWTRPCAVDVGHEHARILSSAYGLRLTAPVRLSTGHVSAQQPGLSVCQPCAPLSVATGGSARKCRPTCALHQSLRLAGPWEVDRYGVAVLAPIVVSDPQRDGVEEVGAPSVVAGQVRGADGPRPCSTAQAAIWARREIVARRSGRSNCAREDRRAGPGTRAGRVDRTGEPAHRSSAGGMSAVRRSGCVLVGHATSGDDRDRRQQVPRERLVT